MSTEDHENMRRSPEEIAALMELLSYELTENVAHGREISSPREGYAMLLEELELLWEAIKAGDASRAMAMATGLSVMAAQFILDHTAPNGIIRIATDHADRTEAAPCGGDNPLADVEPSEVEEALRRLLTDGKPGEPQ